MLTLGAASASFGVFYLFVAFVTVVTIGVVLAVALIFLRVIPSVGSHRWRQLVDTKVRNETPLILSWERIPGLDSGVSIAREDIAATDNVLAAATRSPSGRNSDVWAEGPFSYRAHNSIDVGHPTIEVTPVPIHSTSQGSKDIEFCKRVPVHGVSRIKLQNYAKAYRVMVVPSVAIHDKWHSKIHICFRQ
ncbi:hypothetical protein Tco_0941155 [Tanacetum coccineum]|uniref:Uncharacterized protein n=1 Tax=Tanacetum coccineum TaxID=301880 RepID=A0ABQ5DQL9_9ASTR